MPSEIEKLREALTEAEFWLDGALTCEHWQWDADQREAASCSLDNIRNAIATLSQPEAAGGGVTVCATEGCENGGNVYFERGGVGSHYCGSCYLKVQATPHTLSTPQDTPRVSEDGGKAKSEPVAWAGFHDGKLQVLAPYKSHSCTEPLFRTPPSDEAAKLREQVERLTRERDEALTVLRDHHRWHIEAGELGLPDGDGGWIAIDLSAEYGDSSLYERTAPFVDRLPPEHKPMSRAGAGSNHWENWVLAVRRLKAAECRAEAAEARLAQAERAEVTEARNPDYVYNPQEWEYTCDWGDRYLLTDDLPFGHIMEVNTLFAGAPKFVARVPVSFDEDGDADHYEVQWFDSRAEAEAELQPQEQGR